MALVIKLRRGTTGQWAGSSRVLQIGELGLDTTLNKIKSGDGTSLWGSLPFLNVLPSELTELSQDAVNAALVAGTGLSKTYNDGANTITLNIDTATIATTNYVDSAITGVNNQSGTTYVLVSDIGVADGVASLDPDGKVPDSQIPAAIARDSELSSHTSASTSVHGIADTSALATKTYADNAASTAAAAVVAAAPAALNTLNELAAALGNDASYASTITTALATKAATADIAELAQDAVGGSLSNLFVYNDSTGGITLDNAKVSDFLMDGASGNSYGLIGTSAYLDVKNTNGYNKEIELDITAVEAKLVTDGFAKLNSPTFTGTVAGITSTMVGLGNVDNVSTATIYSNQYVLVTGTSRTISSTTDKFNVVEFNSSNPITVTIPNDTQDAGWPIGSSVEIRQIGTGQISVTKDAAVTYYAPDSQFKSRVQWSSLFLEKRAANSWLVTGDATA